MTEEEAKTKICPIIQIDEGFVKCRASGCMAWRLVSPLVPDDGFCGLAGPLPLPRFGSRGEDC